MVTDMRTLFLLFSLFASVIGFSCFKDICIRGLQYCVPERRKCFWCTDIPHLCGTSKLPLQCDAYCTGLEANKRELHLNGTFEEELERAIKEGTRFKISSMILPVLGIAVGILLSCLGVYLYQQRKKKLVKETDPENAELMDKHVNSDSKVDEMSQTDFRKDSCCSGDFSAVSLTSNTKPETTSKESGVDSLDSEQDGDQFQDGDQVRICKHFRDGGHFQDGDKYDCASDTELILSESKKTDLKKQNAPGKEIGTQKERKTHAMNPTIRKDDTFGVALNGDQTGQIYKNSVRPIGYASS